MILEILAKRITVANGEGVKDTAVKRAEKLEVLVFRREDSKNMKEVVNEKERMLSEFEFEFEFEYGNILVEDDLVNYTKSCVKGIFSKYYDLFSEDNDLV